MWYAVGKRKKLARFFRGTERGRAMGYAFDMARLEAAVTSLYGGGAAAAQMER